MTKICVVVQRTREAKPVEVVYQSAGGMDEARETATELSAMDTDCYYYAMTAEEAVEAGLVDESYLA